jgi:glyoxylase-like metal-dependent hydrolase (beta-lactamase superfamily II)
VDPEEAAAIEVVPGLWRLRLPLPWPGNAHVNAYAIAREDGVLLVDCGTAGDPTCAAALENSLAAAGFGLEDVSLLALTHFHSDHAGLAAHVCERSGAPLWAHPDHDHAYRPIREPEAELAWRSRFLAREGVEGARIASYASVAEENEAVLAAVPLDRPLTEGVEIDTALGPWRVLETPGHSPSHVCLVQPESGLAIVGDLICAAFAPWFDYGWTPDPCGEFLRSLDRLLDIDGIEIALPGHGRPIEDTAGVTAMQRGRTLERLQRTRELLAAEPLDAYEVTTRLYGEVSDPDGVIHLSEALADLRHLRVRGETEVLEGEDGIRRNRPRRD